MKSPLTTRLRKQTPITKSDTIKITFTNMKRSICFIIFISALISCGGGSGDSSSPTPEPQNTAPSVPSLTAPTTSKLCISNTISFEWTAATDAEKNPIVYQIQIATDNQFAQIVSTSETSATTKTITLDKAKAYYWRVKAMDDKNASSTYSSTNNFYTEGDAVANHLPFLPQRILPELNSQITGNSTTLEWSASDVDPSDSLVYDVYLGTTNPPTIKVAENTSSRNFKATSLQVSSIYYWKIVVKDNKGGETIGQVWNFKTN